MKKILILAFISSFAFFANKSAQAGDREFADIYAECGIGGMIFGEGEGESSRVLAIVSNVTWDLGTTAHSSNASSEDTCKNSEAKTAAFIYHSYPSIESDLAKGNGEFLTAMLDSVQCDVPRTSMISELRSNIAEQVNAIGTNIEIKSAVLYDTLASGCAT